MALKISASMQSSKMIPQIQSPRGLRLWLLLLSLTATVPVLLFAGFAGFAVIEFDRVARTAILADLDYRSKALQRSTEQVITAATITMNSLAESGNAQAGDWRGLYDHAKRVISHDQFLRAVTLVDSAGNLVFHTSAPFGAPLFKANEMASAEAAMRTGRVSVSGAFKAPISPKSVTAVSVLLRQGSEKRYVLRAIVLTESVDNALAAAALPIGWIAGVSDSRGTLMARSVGADAFVGKPASQSFLEGIRRGDGRPHQGTTLEGTVTTMVVLPVHGGDWHVSVAVPDSMLNAALYQSIWQFAWIALFAVGLAFAMSYAFSIYLTRQARVLVDAVTRRSAVAPSGTPLRIKEFAMLFAGVMAARHREAEATGKLISARVQRDEVFDLYEHAPCGYHSLDRDGRLVRMNATALRWLGYRWEEVQNRPITDLFDAQSKLRSPEHFAKLLQAGRVENFEVVMVRKDGSTFSAVINASTITDAEGQMLISRSTIFDITERKQLEARLDQLARTDTLTGLSNRRDFYERAAREMHRSKRHEVPMAVFMLDIDHFKRINDEHGHDGGDLVLQQMAGVCESLLRNVDLLARMGGEEFAVMLPDTSAERAVEVAERLRQAVAALTVLLPSGQTVRFTASIGIAMCRGADADIDVALKRADVALYQAKAAGRNQVRVAAAEVSPAGPAHRVGEPSGPDANG